MVLITGATPPSQVRPTASATAGRSPTEAQAGTKPDADSPNKSESEVELCKTILQSGRISWGGGTAWAPVNIDRLCSGTKDAKKTIECFQSNVEAAGWDKAIEMCK